MTRTLLLLDCLTNKLGWLSAVKFKYTIR